MPTAPATQTQMRSIQTQMRYARIAGFVFLLLIVMFMGGQFITSHIAGSGDFTEQLQHIMAGAQLYRAALWIQMLTSVLTVLLAYGLYVAVRSVDEDLARLAMYWRLGEAFIGGAASIMVFAQLNLFTEPKYLDMLGADKLQMVIGMINGAASVSFNITTTFFSVGSTLFFYLFLKSRSIPVILSTFGIFASIVVLLTSLANLVFPEYADVIKFGWAPIFISEITTGIWLLVRGVKPGIKISAAASGL